MRPERSLPHLGCPHQQPFGFLFTILFPGSLCEDEKRCAQLRIVPCAIQKGNRTLGEHPRFVIFSRLPIDIGQTRENTGDLRIFGPIG